jgi:hypothetical protein
MCPSACFAIGYIAAVVVVVVSIYIVMHLLCQPDACCAMSCMVALDIYIYIYIVMSLVYVVGAGFLFLNSECHLCSLGLVYYFVYV